MVGDRPLPRRTCKVGRLGIIFLDRCRDALATTRRDAILNSLAAAIAAAGSAGFPASLFAQADITAEQFLQLSERLTGAGDLDQDVARTLLGGFLATGMARNCWGLPRAAAATRHLSRLQRTDHTQLRGRPRTGDGTLGHADAAAVPGRQASRSGGDQHSAGILVALATLGSAPDHRCLIPFTSFAENELQPDGSRPPVWFAFDESRPLAFFAGIWASWTSVRKLKEGRSLRTSTGC